MKPNVDIAKSARLCVYSCSCPPHLICDIWISTDSRITAATVVKIVYGMDIDDMDDEYVQLAEMTMQGLAKGHIPGAFWVEYFPFLRHIPSWVPGAHFKKLADKYRPFSEAMVQKPYDHVLQKLVCAQPAYVDSILICVSKRDGVPVPCVASTMIRDTQNESLEESERLSEEAVRKDVLATIYAGVWYRHPRIVRTLREFPHSRD